MLISKDQTVVDALDSIKTCEDWLSSIEYEIDEVEELDVSRPIRKIQEEIDNLRMYIDQMDEQIKTAKYIQYVAEKMLGDYDEEENKDLETIAQKLSYWFE